ncbi:MAG: adenylate/guanylate cyclase domain-containing protein [Gammaproteobacteria bacterium]|nr:adenylate/guanylate cyclase domain-containing protein [Gammaproteobacteria bacterium]
MAREKTEFKLHRALLIAALSIAFTLASYYSGLLNLPEGWSYDLRMTYTQKGTQLDDRVAVVLIDDASLNALDDVAGRWPWPRSIHADLIDFLSLGNPRAVLFDITFFEKALFNPKVEDINPHDQRLVLTTHILPNVYHAMRLVVDKEDDVNKGLLNQDIPPSFAQRLSLENRYQSQFDVTNLNIDIKTPSNNVFYLPFPELADAANGIGVVDMNSENDGVYRTARLFHRYGEQIYPALSVTSVVDQILPPNIVRRGGNIHFGDLKIPVDEREHMWVKFYENYPAYSYSGLIASQFQIQNGDLENLMVDPALFEDKIVFVGASAAGLEDLKHTPIDARLPGVMIHASIASSILNQDFLTPPNRIFTLLLVILLAILTSIGSLMPRSSWAKNANPAWILLGFGSAAYFAFQHGWVLEMAAPSTAIVAAWVLAFSVLVFTEGKEKRRFKRMMSQYLSPAVLQTVVSNHEEFAKAEVGTRENISILFSDIRSFTNMSEQLAPEKVVEMLNHYFSSMTDAIFTYEGTIDKFIGDAIMAFWGAPIKVENHADRATLAAVDMLYRLQEVNKWLQANQYPSIAIGVGIHTGDAILGNIGSENKLDYTIIGDNVNLASRIEGLTKTYHSQILITEDTYQRLSVDMPCQMLDLVKVKGKQHPIRIYRPLAHPERSSTEHLKQAKLAAEASENAFAAYLKRDWEKAKAIWSQFSDDPVSEELVKRCNWLRKNPPGDDWDGSHTMTTK